MLTARQYVIFSPLRGPNVSMPSLAAAIIAFLAFLASFIDVTFDKVAAFLLPLVALPFLLGVRNDEDESREFLLQNSAQEHAQAE